MLVVTLGDPLVDALMTAGTAIATQYVADHTQLGAEIMAQACQIARGPAGVAGLSRLVDPARNPGLYSQLAHYVSTSCQGVQAGHQASTNRAAQALPQYAGNPGAQAVFNTVNAVSPAPAAAQYPAGAITAFAPKRGGWPVAVPMGQGRYRIAEVAAAAPAGVPVVDLKTFEKRTGTAPWYRTGWGIAAIVIGGAAVVGGGGYAVSQLAK